MLFLHFERRQTAMISSLDPLLRLFNNTANITIKPTDLQENDIIVQFDISIDVEKLNHHYWGREYVQEYKYQIYKY